MVSVVPTENPTTIASAVAIASPVAGSWTTLDVDDSEARAGLPWASPMWASASLPFSLLSAARWRGPLSCAALGLPGYWLETMNGYGGMIGPCGPRALAAPMRAGMLSPRYGPPAKPAELPTESISARVTTGET